MSPNTSPRAPGIAFDAGVAAAIGLVVALSPTLTANRVAVKALGGFVVALALFAYRRRLRRSVSEGRPERAPEGEIAHSKVPGPSDPSATQPGWLLWLGLALFIALALPTFRGLLPQYLDSVWQNGHGLLLPALLVGVVRAIHRRAGLPVESPAASGPLLVAAGVALALLDVGVRTYYVAIAGWIAIAAGLVLSFFGRRALFVYWPAIALLAFFVPLSPTLGADLAMPIASAEATRMILDATGHAVNRVAALVVMPQETYGVSVRCSGFASMFAGAALAFALAAAAGRWRRFAIILVALWPITIAANGLRLALLMMFCQWRGVLASATPMHGLSGLLAFWMVIGAVLAIASRTERRALLGAA